MIRLGSYGNIVGALILRDLRTRYGRTHLGYLMAVAWPLSHLVTIVTLMSLANRVTPLGNDPAVFVSSGVMPYILCLYPARMMGIAIETNKPLFLFPVIKPIYIILSRGIIEFLTAFLVVILFFVGALAYGVDIIPPDPAMWGAAVSSTIYLSVCMGFFNTIVSSIFKMWNILFLVVMFALYSTSGVFILPSTLSQEMRDAMWFNPLVHCVEWIRASYYEGYGDDMLSPAYLIGVATCFLFLSLLGERFLRGKLLAP